MSSSWVEYTEPKWRNFDMTQLKVDESFINLINNLSPVQKLSIYYLFEDCYKCPYQKLKYNKEIQIDGSRPITLKVFNESQGEYVFENETTSICTIKSHLGEFGVYNMTLNEEGCSFSVDKEPVNIYFPMLLIFLIIITVACFYKLYCFGYQKYKARNEEITANIRNEIDTNSNQKKRLKSLDVFRGMAITLMIFVNSGGGHYFWIEHAPWNGLHVADIVFPSFLWIMGVAIPFAVRAQLNRSASKYELVKHILVRSIKLFLIGLCLNSILGPLLEELRIMGVLQRFGIAYFVCATTYVIFAKNPLILPEIRYKFYIYDLTLMREQLILSSVLVAIYLGITFGLKVPNCPLGYLGPGGVHDYLKYENCTGGAAGYIDNLILGEKHKYQHSTAKALYKAKNFDPEGVFGCLLSIVQVFFGIHCGVILQVYITWKARCIRLLIYTIILGVLGGGLCCFTKESGLIPINKNLWSLTFVFSTSAIAFLIIGILYIVVDLKSIWSGKPFLQAGMNSIILYVGHSVLHKMLPWHWRIGLMNTHFVLLVESLWNTALWVLISIYLHKQNIFYNV